MVYCQKTRYANDETYREHKKKIMRRYINEKREKERRMRNDNDERAE